MGTKMAGGLDGGIENSVYSSWRRDLIPTPCPWKGQLLVFSYLMNSNREKDCYTLSEVRSERVIGNRHKLQQEQFQIDIKKKNHNDSCQKMEQASQRGCGVSIPQKMGTALSNLI